MSFTMFMTWILVGVLAGLLADQIRKPGGYGLKADITLGLVGSIGGSWFLRAVGIFTGSGIAAAAVFALMGASVLIVGQRKLWATEGPAEKKAPMWRWGLPAAIAVVVIWMTLGAAQQPAAIAAGTEDKA